MKKISFLVFLILAMAAAVFADEGPNLVVRRVDGKTFRGELLSIDGTVVILKVTPEKARAIRIGDIDWIRAEQRTHQDAAADGLGTDWMEAVLALDLNSDRDSSRAIHGMLLGGGIVLILESLVQSLPTVEYKTYQFKGRSDEEIQEMLKSLRTMARCNKES